LPIDIAGGNKGTSRHRVRQFQQDPEAFMGYRATVQIQAMTVEAPCQARMSSERRGRRNRLEMEAGFPQGGICLPEPFGTTEVGEARIDAHPGACGNQEAVSLIHKRRSAHEQFVMLEVRHKRFHRPS
jgi:hypothetical protein